MSKRPYRYTSDFYRKVKLNTWEKLNSISKLIEKQNAEMPSCSVSSVLSDSDHNNYYKDDDAITEELDNVTKNSDVEEVDIEQERLLNNQLYLLEQLRVWALKHNVPHTTINALLKIMNTINIVKLPEDSRTLLQTPKHITDVTSMGNGQFWYHGLKSCLFTCFQKLASKCSNFIVTILFFFT